MQNCRLFKNDQKLKQQNKSKYFYLPKKRRGKADETQNAELFSFLMLEFHSNS